MFLVDSHCHLNQLDYQNVHKNVSDVLEKAKKKGVKLVLSVSTNLSDYKNMIDYIGYRKDVLFSCGIHPIDLCSIEQFSYNELYNLASDKNVVAIGETGLDFYRDTDKNNHIRQQESLKKHIDVAKNLGKPLIIHSREASKNTIMILCKEHAEKCGGILHCFNENIDFARSLLNINFYISFSGIVTLRNSDILKKVIQYTPLDHILLETDSPYLTPLPYRGQENQPAYIYEIAKYISCVKKVSIDHLACSTTSNFYKLFNLPQQLIS